MGVLGKMGQIRYSMHLLNGFKQELSCDQVVFFVSFADGLSFVD